MKKKYAFIIALSVLFQVKSMAQKRRGEITGKSKQMEYPEKKVNRLYQFGVADGFINAMYEGSLPVGSLKVNGVFGTGSPDLIDGETNNL